MYRILLLISLLSASCQTPGGETFSRKPVKELDASFQSDHSYCLKHKSTNGYKRCMVINGWHPDDLIKHDRREGIIY